MLTILDDAQYPVIEGLETFVVYLSSPHGAELTKPFQAVVAINDIFQDGMLPTAARPCPPQPCPECFHMVKAAPSWVDSRLDLAHFPGILPISLSAPFLPVFHCPQELGVSLCGHQAS